MLGNLSKLVNMEADLMVLRELEETTGENLSQLIRELEYKIEDLINRNQSNQEIHHYDRKD